MNDCVRFPDPVVGPYRLRPVSEQDRPLLDHFIARDPFHAGRVTANFFLRLFDGEGAWAVEDALERVIFYLKTENAVRLHIQFGPSESPANRERNRDAMTEGVEWLGRQIAANGFRSMVFDSQNPTLIRHATKRLGFQGELFDFWRGVTPPARGAELDPRSPGAGEVPDRRAN